MRAYIITRYARRYYVHYKSILAMFSSFLCNILPPPCSDVLVIPTMKLYVYHSLAPDSAPVDTEARLNVMHAVYLCLQTSSNSDEDNQLKAEQIFQTLFNRHFNEKLTVRIVYIITSS